MAKKLIHFSIALVFVGMFLWACSSNTGEESEKGAIRQMTDKVADEMVHKMRDPIDKARLARESGEDHLSDLEDAAEDSSQTE